jgi:hypothetical protein
MGQIITTDDINTNFRKIRLGAIASGVLYRSEHPVPGGKPDKPVITLARAARINTVINLSDDMQGLRECAAASPWYESLLSRGNIIGICLDFDFGQHSFNEKIRRALDFMLDHEGPYLIHCYAGVDRTGFLCAVLEALMGASLKEIVKDYRRSFDKGGTSAVFSGDPSAAGAEILKQLAAAVNMGTPLTDETSRTAAARYLEEDVGLGKEKVAELKWKLAGWDEHYGTARSWRWIGRLAYSRDRKSVV